MANNSAVNPPLRQWMYEMSRSNALQAAAVTIDDRYPAQSDQAAQAVVPESGGYLSLHVACIPWTA